MENIKRAPRTFDSQSQMKDFVLDCERDFQIRLDQAIEELLGREQRVFALSGPTCSGKTTAAKKLIDEIAKRGRGVNVISIDDFYYDKEVLHRMSSDHGNDEIDYDSPRTIDLDALRSFAEGIFNGGELLCPIFDFHSGSRTGYRSIKSDKKDIFIFEGIQALYPQVTSILERHGFCGAYISPMYGVGVGDTVVDPNELRLLRRLVRDSNFRSTSADFTFKIWQSVRKNEEANIFPFADMAEIRIDSSFAYELGMLKPYLMQVLRGIDKDSIYRPYSEKIQKAIADIEEIPSEFLPENSLYREFI